MRDKWKESSLGCEGLIGRQSFTRFLNLSSRLLRGRQLALPSVQTHAVPGLHSVNVCVELCAVLSLESNKGGEAGDGGA